MDGQVALKLARLLRLGPQANAPEISRLMGTLTPAERPQVQRAARSINSMSAFAGDEQSQETIRTSLARAGWNWSQEGSSPGGSAIGWGRGRLRIDVPGEEPRWRTIKVPFDPDMSWEDFWGKVQNIIDGWNSKYPDAEITFDVDDFVWF